MVNLKRLFDSTDVFAEDLYRYLNSSGCPKKFQAQYVGLLTILCAQALENAIRYIFIQFAVSKHEILGNVAQKHFHKMVGGIRLDNLIGNHVTFFGDNYKKKFLSVCKKSLNQSKDKVEKSYDNLILWRNEFAHTSNNPQATIKEVKDAYSDAKKIIQCLNKTMQ